jgi:tRNA A58 N-methylase Trm61
MNDIDHSVVKGENAFELTITRTRDIYKLLNFNLKLMDLGFRTYSRLCLLRENIADVLNVISNIDIEFNDIKIEKVENIYLLFVDIELPHALSENAFMRSTEGLWICVSIYIMNNDDLKLIYDLIEKYGLDVIRLEEIIGRSYKIKEELK